MANDKYIKINGVLFNYKLNSVSVSRTPSAPDEANLIAHMPYTATRPRTGQSFEVFLRDDSKYFGGTIDDVNWKGAFEIGDQLEVSIKASGYNNRLFMRTTFDHITNLCARYTSIAAVVNAAGAAITWVSGDKFFKGLVGKSVSIGGAPYTVTAVTSPNAFTVSGGTTGSGLTFAYDVYSGDVVKDLLDHYASGEGFTYTGTSIQQGVKIKDILFDPPVSVAAAIKQLLDINPTFYFNPNADQKCYFAAKTLVAAPKDFTSTSGAYERGLEVTETREDVRNVEVSSIAWGNVDATVDSFTGDGVTNSWFLTKPLNQLKTFLLNGVAADAKELNFGEVPTTGDSQYYYRANDNALWADVSTPVLTVTDTLEVTYLATGDNLFEYEDDTQIFNRQVQEGSGSGRYEEVIDRSGDLYPTFTVALADAVDSVTRLGTDLIKAKLKTFDAGYDRGQIVTVNITDRAINQQMFIDEIHCTDDYSTGNTATNKDFEYELVLISASRLASADILRGLFGGGGSISGSGGGGIVSGSAGSSKPGWYDLALVAGHIKVDLANGLRQRFVLSAGALPLDVPIWTGGSIDPGDSFILYIDQPASGSVFTAPAFDTGTHGFRSEVSNKNIRGLLNTRSSYQFTYDGSKWWLDSFTTGSAL